MLTKTDKDWIKGNSKAERKWVERNFAENREWVERNFAENREWVERNFAENREWIKKNFATKDDLSGTRISLRTEMAKIEERIEEKAQRRHNELMGLFDGLAKEVRDNEEFRLVTNHRVDRLESLARANWGDLD